ncbi:hypothetical protein CRUP_027442 [Coryphaenoides rupestris]|nr:hypothetical protein CRUP_027442 [Coryphaenoides rupestris]
MATSGGTTSGGSLEAPPLRVGSVLSEVTATSRHYVDRLFDPDPQNVLQGVIDMKNAVIGNNKQKANLIVLGAVPRLLYLLQQGSSSSELHTECAVVLGSLAMGTENNIKSLVDCHTIPALLQDLTFIEACLRCLRTVFISPVTPVQLLYTDPTVIPHLMSLLSHSQKTQEYITQMFSHCCKTPEHQTVLFSHGAVQNMAPLLIAASYKVRMQALKCFSVLAYENVQVSAVLVDVLVDGETLSQVFVRMMQRDKPIEMQLTAAKCLTFMCRAGSIRTDHPCIVLKTLPCLVRMCSKERLLEERVEGAETLAYLLEPDVELQRVASTTDHLVAMLADYFKYPSSVSAITDIKRLDHDLKHAHELRQAAFKLYASLGSNDEDIRKKITETENMMDRIVSGLSESSIKVRLAAVRCLHSLSRSVQQLRTSFHDHALLQNAPDEVLITASSTLCNLLLEFSPSKELFRLLSDPDPHVLMKTLGLLRNLLSTRPHIDQVMTSHGKQIMQAITLILEGEHSMEVKEQERQDRLRELGFVDILHKLTQSPDTNLCDRAKTAMQQYLA